MSASAAWIEPVTAQAPPLRGRVLMNQDWVDLLYLHWVVDPERIAPHLPAGVRPDLFEDRAWIGLVPFTMVGAGFGAHTSVPYVGSFLETNVRTYAVDAAGRRSVVFLSLDTDRLAIVLGARASLRMPYRWARMRHRVVPGAGEGPTGDEHRWTLRLRGPRPGGRAVASDVGIRVGEPRSADDRDRFLTARWRVHTRQAGRTLFVPNHHGEWPLYDVTVSRLDDGLVAGHGFGDVAARPPDHAAFSPGVHTEFGFPRLA